MTIKNKRNLGIDFHDTLSYDPDFFRILMSIWITNDIGKVFIITGTPESKRQETIEQLNNINILHGREYNEILMGFEYDKNDMDVNHFKRMQEHKLKHLLANNVRIYWDDNPHYVNIARNYGITVFQPILSKKYIEEFEKKDKFFTCNLQTLQFDFLNNLKPGKIEKLKH